MQGNRSKDTKPERVLRGMLWNAGFRGYRKNLKTLPGKPDLVFTRLKVAVFVHGCFWHSCPRCYDKRWREPKTNTEYWLKKLSGNLSRDETHQTALKEMGFRVLVVWECDVRRNPQEAAGQVISTLQELTALQGKSS